MFFLFFSWMFFFFFAKTGPFKNAIFLAFGARVYFSQKKSWLFLPFPEAFVSEIGFDSTVNNHLVKRRCELVRISWKKCCRAHVRRICRMSFKSAKITKLHGKGAFLVILPSGIRFGHHGRLCRFPLAGVSAAPFSLSTSPNVGRAACNGACRFQCRFGPFLFHHWIYASLALVFV